MRYHKPAVEVEAMQWTGDNLQALQDRFGAGTVRLLVNDDGDGDGDMLELTTDVASGEACYVRVGEWIIGDRVESGWQLNRVPAAAFEAQGFKPAYRDRNEHYVPEGLYLDGKPQYAEISPAREISPRVLRNLVDSAATLLTGSWARFEDVANQGGTRYDTAPIREWLNLLDDYTGPDGQEYPARYARIAYGDPDENNRDDGRWWWADISGDGTHWAHFSGHRMQVDLKLSTGNERDVNEWKGRDNIRPGGHWTLRLNRQPMGDGYIGTDVHRTLQKISRTLEKLADHPALDHSSALPYAEQLAGRRVYYQRHPAVVSGDVLSQGCVILSPVGSPFPKAVYDFDAEGTENDSSDAYERRTVKVELDSPEIWWHRRRAFGDEQSIVRRGTRVAVEAHEPVPVEADDENEEGGS